MNRTIWHTAFTILLAGVALAQSPQIIGYYPSWKWGWRGDVMTPEKIPFQKLTMINYAFFYPLSDGSLVGRDTAGDRRILKGEWGQSEDRHQPRTGLVTLAHRYGVKVLLSIGGWEDSSNFPDVAASEAKRARFARSCIEKIQEYDLDGIDIDWEYPGYAPHNGKAQDRENFTHLLRATRDALSEHGQRIGRKLLLTAALPAAATILANYDVARVTDLLDLFNVMTYDLSGTWDTLSGHNAPLFAPTDLDTLRNVDAAFRLYTVTYGVPAAKVCIGIPFYGHSFARCEGVYQPHAGPDTTHIPPNGCFYSDIVREIGNFRRSWDERAKVPFLVNQEWKTFVSYDDEESVGLKADYALEHKAGGVIVWEITGDFLPGGGTPLLDVISEKLGRPVGK